MEGEGRGSEGGRDDEKKMVKSGERRRREREKRGMMERWPTYSTFPGESAVPASALQARILTTLPGLYVS